MSAAASTGSRSASAAGGAGRPVVVSVIDGQASIGGRVVWSGVNIEIREGEFAASSGPTGRARRRC